MSRNGSRGPVASLWSPVRDLGTFSQVSRMTRPDRAKRTSAPSVLTPALCDSEASSPAVGAVFQDKRAEPPRDGGPRVEDIVGVHDRPRDEASRPRVRRTGLTEFTGPRADSRRRAVVFPA